MPADLTICFYVIGGLGAAGLAVFGYLNFRINRTDDKIESARDKIKESAVDRANLRNDLTLMGKHVAENYTTKSEMQVVKVDTQHSIDRIYDMIDQIRKSIADMPQVVTNSVTQTIIALIGKGGGA